MFAHHNSHSTSLRSSSRLTRRAALAAGLSLVCGSLAFVVGCGGEPGKKGAETHHPGDGHKPGEAGHAHAEEGPHKGQLIELGKEEYHGELLHDDAAHKITIYLLDGQAKKSVPVAEKELSLNVVADGKPAQYKLAAAPQADDPAGQASRFELVDHALCEALDDPKSKGRLNVVIGGKTYAGDIGHHDHDEKK